MPGKEAGEMGTRKGPGMARRDDGDRLVNEIRSVCDGVRDRLCRVAQGKRVGLPSVDEADAILEDAVWLNVRRHIDRTGE
jgi:hypothetical protein